MQTVPITSDLGGYVTFWTRAFISFVVLLFVLAGSNFYLLWQILQAVRAQGPK